MSPLVTSHQDTFALSIQPRLWLPGQTYWLPTEAYTVSSDPEDAVNIATKYFSSDTSPVC